MTSNEQAERAEAFRRRHHRAPLLLLPNAWDALSARLFLAAGFEAVATTSGGLAWALGYPDGEKAPWNEVVAATARIVRAAGAAPVTADIEAGYAETPEALMRRIGEIIAAGAVGVNLEDGIPGNHAAPLRPVTAAAERIRAARAAAQSAGVPIVVNARTDLYLRESNDEAARFAETVERGKAYLAAGADCVYPIGLRDPATIGRLVEALAAPVNIVIRAGAPSVAELAELGVARASTATSLTLATMAAIRGAAEALRATGRFTPPAGMPTHAEAQRLFAQES
ncbi:MAG TPA: isocitrate lyase/phosphoenolpyruvate mutase family protein [Stellaceae bacterium]|nr:isocitrate lyase/phosphoenolpyruvate mutase family protein [Stellaceae bacterium]